MIPGAIKAAAGLIKLARRVLGNPRSSVNNGKFPVDQ
jgi:hypothetical protein